MLKIEQAEFCLKQPIDQMLLNPSICKYSFTRLKFCLSICRFSLATFKLQGQNLVVATETLWPTQPKLFIFWPYTENFGQPLAQGDNMRPH
jgi:hypothetical protein